MMELLEKVYEDLVKAVEKENKAAATRQNRFNQIREGGKTFQKRIC